MRRGHRCQLKGLQKENDRFAGRPPICRRAPALCRKRQIPYHFTFCAEQSHQASI
ncbi:hypothetical protein ACUSIJ_27400 [Pseudochelatococcus sp. B33]